MDFSDSSMMSMAPAEHYSTIKERPFGGDWTRAPHSHATHEIALVTRGSCRILLENEERPLKKYDAFLLPSGVVHGFRAEPPGVSYAGVHFPYRSTALIRPLINRPPIGCFHLSDVNESQFMEIIYQLEREIAGNLAFAALQCRSLVEQLIVMLARIPTHEGARALSATQRELVEQALRWMHERAKGGVQVKEVAEFVGLSASHFRKLFERHVGVSPKAYLLTLRLQAGKSLLAQSDQTVTEIADLTGFNTPQQFCKAFRRHTGLTPLQWRKIHLKSFATQADDAPIMKN